MKEASGELNMTVVTIVAIAAILGLFVTVFYPMIQESIESSWGESADQMSEDMDAFRQ